jgi:hypothetical protein
MLKVADWVKRLEGCAGGCRLRFSSWTWRFEKQTSDEGNMLAQYRLLLVLIVLLVAYTRWGSVSDTVGLMTNQALTRLVSPLRKRELISATLRDAAVGLEKVAQSPWCRGC